MMYSVYLLLAAIVCWTALAKSSQSNYYKDCGAGPNYQLRSKRIASGGNAVPNNSWPSMVRFAFDYIDLVLGINLCLVVNFVREYLTGNDPVMFISYTFKKLAMPYHSIQSKISRGHCIFLKDSANL